MGTATEIEATEAEPKRKHRVADVPTIGCLVGRAVVLGYIFQGYVKASPFILTIKSKASGKSFTYRLRPLKLSDYDRTTTASIYVDLKTGPEEDHWTWIGLLSWTGARDVGVETTTLAQQALTKPMALLSGNRCGHQIGASIHAPGVGSDAPSVKGLEWLVARLNAGMDPAPAAEVWHDGRCCVCRRALTRPESVAVGVGPDCLERLGAAAVLAFNVSRGAA